MVTRRKMTIDRFIPSAQPSTQPQVGDRAPSPPAASHPKKKLKVGDHPSKVPSEVPTKTPPWGRITIRELMGGSQPPAKGSKDIASLSWTENI